MAQTAEQVRIEELQEEIAFLKQELGLLQNANRRAKVQGPIGLTRLEADILLCLHDRNRLMTKDAIFNAAWGPTSDVEIKIVDVMICKLRKKLGIPGAIETIWGVGYRLTEVGAQRVKELLDNVPA